MTARPRPVEMRHGVAARTAACTELVAWSRGGDRDHVRVVTGAPGVGKSRMGGWAAHGTHPAGRQ
ncbi:hypothetical protein [Streptomyces sp. MST-110588]|uniref:hypothetical protein n=1 Tax=Streptomyces sp. MST-110588 TaxID=2833628 RepID=UPI001F5CFA1A|nr:hypothetical protein [Streptomyces sp. MST-110588]UNO43384.1 hypothetical protein KGS77_32770 [Streptomyces sp. MST-110588]